MKIAVACAVNGHYKAFMAALANGIAASDDEALPTTPAQAMGRIQADAFVCWGWRVGKRIRQVHKSLPVLVMERGYVGDRFHWTSLGWNGLNGRAIFPRPPKGEHALGYSTLRFQGFNGPMKPWPLREGYSYDMMTPWRCPTPQAALDAPGYALILGQVQGDQACLTVNLASQYRAWAAMYGSAGLEVRFRPHPKAITQRSGLPLSQHTSGTLAEDLAGAKFTISWNSNSSVDSVLAGVPSVTLDRGAMAWPVTSHDLNNPVTMPSRTEWAAQLAWCQWQPEELADGGAWRAVRECMP